MDLKDKKNVKLISLAIAAAFIIGMFAMTLTQSGIGSGVASAAASESAVGVVNYQSLIMAVPEVAGVQTAMQEEVKTAQEEFATKSAEMNDTEKQRYSQQLQERLGNKEKELMEPVYAKLDSAIQKVAKRKGLSVVVDKGIVVFGGVDVTAEVSAELAKK